MELWARKCGNNSSFYCIFRHKHLCFYPYTPWLEEGEGIVLKLMTKFVYKAFLFACGINFAFCKTYCHVLQSCWDLSKYLRLFECVNLSYRSYLWKSFCKHHLFPLILQDCWLAQFLVLMLICQLFLFEIFLLSEKILSISRRTLVGYVSCAKVNYLLLFDLEEPS